MNIWKVNFNDLNQIKHETSAAIKNILRITFSTKLHTILLFDESTKQLSDHIYFSKLVHAYYEYVYYSDVFKVFMVVLEILNCIWLITYNSYDEGEWDNLPCKNNWSITVKNDRISIGSFSKIPSLL